MTTFGLVLAFTAAQTTAAPPTAPPPQPACATSEHRALDFWVGEWIAYDTAGKRIGTNRITRDEYGSCVITEHFRLDDGSMIGHSVSMYRPGIKQWRQTWVDNQGGHFDLFGGPVSAADHIFVLENKRVTDTQPHQRMIFQDVKSDSFTWRWQRRAKADEPWADSWVLHYRKPPGGGASGK